jgi:hypothetical protein
MNRRLGFAGRAKVKYVRTLHRGGAPGAVLRALRGEPELAAAQPVNDRIEHIKMLAEDLSHAARGSSVARALLDRIRAELDWLKTESDLNP